METKNWLQKKIESLKDDFEFRFETLVYNITEKFSVKMKQKSISRTKLARMLGVSSPAVTKLLNGNSNFTLRTLLSVADALELNLKIDFEEKEAAHQVFFSTDTVIVPLASEEEKEHYTINQPIKAYSMQRTAGLMKGMMPINALSSIPSKNPREIVITTE